MPKYIKGIYIKSKPPQDLYISALPVVRNLQRIGELRLNSDVTFLVGENGTGKSTLLEAIALSMGFNAEGGTRNFNFSTAETTSELHEFITVIKGVRPRDGFFLRAESFYNVASYIDKIDSDAPLIDSYGGVSLHCQSHGESFLALVKNRFGGDGIYLLDEPEAALSPSRQMTLLVLMNELVKQNSQFIIATHSPILMAFPNAQVIELTDDGICSVPYRQTEHYKLTKRFLDNPEKMLEYLLN
ncbi:MAG: AAA family ATPase [Firmicutes bacterium]|nr:AAA family ATPase [Bacillota bacterium]